MKESLKQRAIEFIDPELDRLDAIEESGHHAYHRDKYKWACQNADLTASGIPHIRRRRTTTSPRPTAT